MKHLRKYGLRLYDVFLTFGCFVAMEHVVFKTKYDKYYRPELNGTSLVDNICFMISNLDMY